MSAHARERTKNPPAPVLPALSQRKSAFGDSAGLTDPRQESPAAPPAVGEVLRSPGQPLDGETRGLMESRFGHDFGRVRVHADAQAAGSAREMRAAAYTVGEDVAFQAGRYRPDTAAGRGLLAHELTHVVQQEGARAELAQHSPGLTLGRPGDSSEREADRNAEALMTGGGPAPALKASRGAAVPALQRAGDEEWNKNYGKHKSFLQKPFEEFKKGLGDIRATTAGGLSENKGRPFDAQKGAGTPAAPEITFEVLKEIYTGLKADVASDKDKETKAKNYLENVNKAFKIMKIDTVEAQALYLAHAFVESDQFRQFTETQGSVNKGAQKWEEDPAKIKLDTKDLKARYEKMTSVNPGGNYEFIGRGPIQVTHRHEYVEVIAMLEKAADQYKAEADKGDAKAKEYSELARKAAREIKANPAKAADPQYTFLVSAAYMKKFGSDVRAAQVKTGAAWTGTDAASGWVAGGKQKEGSPQAKALVEKANAYAKIYPVLLREANKKSAAARTRSGG
ncbi:MAG TPA: DUF4157 domain-containing protein [Pyrinomonadaceae bacterium]|nr:DUF4157 domain-containing protein [Pyrinomonadaceae bacterium]